MKDLIFLTPYLKEVIWGGTKLKEIYGYETKSNNIGEAWIVSANSNGPSIISNGEFKGLTLEDLYNKRRDLFGNIEENVFPLLIKYIDARQDLSIQVHPDDKYAYVNANKSKGKTECWYVLDCEEGADIIIGHNAKNKEELENMIKEKKWNDLLKIIPIKKGDFFFIPAGTIHAIRKGTLIFETQQNSDVTYRLYDYDRLENGKPRDLHLQQSIDVTTCPHKDIETKKDPEKEGNNTIQNLINIDKFNLTKIDIKDEFEIKQDKNFLIVNILEGNGTVNGIKIKKGDNFIAPYEYGTLKFIGNLTITTIF